MSLPVKSLGLGRGILAGLHGHNAKASFCHRSTAAVATSRGGNGPRGTTIRSRGAGRSEVHGVKREKIPRNDIWVIKTDHSNAFNTTKQIRESTASSASSVAFYRATAHVRLYSAWTQKLASFGKALLASGVKATAVKSKTNITVKEREHRRHVVIVPLLHRELGDTRIIINPAKT